MGKGFNIHENGHSRPEIYDALSQHCSNDSSSLNFWQVAYFICAGFHAYIIDPTVLFFYFAGYCLYKLVYWHSEIAHRHWFLQKLDWEERERNDTDFNEY